MSAVTMTVMFFCNMSIDVRINQKNLLNYTELNWKPKNRTCSWLLPGLNFLDGDVGGGLFEGRHVGDEVSDSRVEMSVWNGNKILVKLLAYSKI